MNVIDDLALTEHEEAVELWRWRAEVIKKLPELGLLVHVPNEGHEGLKRKLAEGLQPDFPDYVLFVARGGYHGWCGELKTKVGYLAPGQRQWLVRLELQDYMAVCCYGWQQMARSLTAYLAQGGVHG